MPVCWPWFGPDSETPVNPDHGFVRNSFWSVFSCDILQNGDIKIVLNLLDNAETKKIWCHHFDLSLEIMIGDKLGLKLFTRNTGEKAFFITEALHTYFKVGDAGSVKLLGLENTDYLDKTKNYKKAFQQDPITFSKETDNIHTDLKHNLCIIDPSLNRKIVISSSGNTNVVVWNPWSEKSLQMADLGKDYYKYFVCIEIANVASNKVEVLPGDEHLLVTNYSCTQLSKTHL